MIDDCLLLVAGYLPARDLARLAGCSKHVRQLVAPLWPRAMVRHMRLRGYYWGNGSSDASVALINKLITHLDAMLRPYVGTPLDRVMLLLGMAELTAGCLQYSRAIDRLHRALSLIPSPATVDMHALAGHIVLRIREFDRWWRRAISGRVH
jgi:hypothetical protein